ncbi:MAG: hypothetical protein FWF00_00705 [Endomicrobia bacterium]|nr:hypothetical protein [Endomicrobiia bacterium]
MIQNIIVFIVVLLAVILIIWYISKNKRGCCDKKSANCSADCQSRCSKLD